MNFRSLAKANIGGPKSYERNGGAKGSRTPDLLNAVASSSVFGLFYGRTNLLI